MRFARLFIQMLRLRVAFTLFIFLVLGIVVHRGQPHVSFALLLGCMSIAAWYVNATCLNDLADVKIDAINLKQATGRPLAHGQASSREILSLGIMAGSLALFAAFLLDTSLGLVIVIGLFLNYAYSFRPIRISYRAYLAPLLLPFGYVAIPFIFGGFLAGTRPLQINWLFLASIWLAFSGRIILKDFRDVVGDSTYDKRTFIVRHGARWTCVVSACLWLLADNLLIACLLTLRPMILPAQIFVVFEWALLFLLSKESGHERQQILIGLLARGANGLILSIILFLYLTQSGYPTSTVALVVWVVVIVLISQLIGLLRNLDTVKIGYRG